MALYQPQDLYSWEQQDAWGWHEISILGKPVWINMIAACEFSGIEFGDAQLAFRWMIDTNFGKYHPPMGNDLYRG